MGGNMGTPPAPSQPPQVNFTTTAESRGGFNNFLKSIPQTTNMTPLPPMGSPQMPPMGGNPMANIDIFNQPMGMMGINQPQMNPMMQQPMQQQPMNMGMMQQPMMMADGGGVPPRRTEIMGQPHMLSYITPEEGGILKALGGSGRPGPMGIPSFYETAEESEGTDAEGSGSSESEGNDSGQEDTSDSYGADMGTDQSSNNNDGDDSDPDQDMDYTDPDYGYTTQDPSTGQDDMDVATQIGQDQAAANAAEAIAQSQKPKTNITNVGPSSNVAYSPQFSADVAQSQGLDPSVTMSPEDYSQTTQGQAAAAAQAAENFSLDQATNNTNVMGNQVQGISRGIGKSNTDRSPGLATAMGLSLDLDPSLGLDLDVPSRGFNVGVGAPQAIGAGRGTGQGFSSYGVPTDPVVGNAPGAASTTTANVATQNAGNIPGVATGSEMMSNVDISPSYSASLNDKEDTLGVLGPGVMSQIEALSVQPTTMTQLGMPPGMINSALSMVENMSRNSIMSDLASGKYSAITDSRGNVTGTRDSFGRVHSGMDMNAPDTGSGENDNNQVKPLNVKKPIVEDPIIDDRPPNVIGGGDPVTTPKGNPFIVDSPFTSNVGDYTPVGFDAGDLNALIARLTGVAAPQSMAQGGIAGYAGGGLISAVDNFLASV